MEVDVTFASLLTPTGVVIAAIPLRRRSPG
jgi:hypothetical protein